MNVTNFSTFFLAFLFGACVLFIPIAIIGAFATKYGDGGEGSRTTFLLSSLRILRKKY